MITPTYEHFGTHDDSEYPELWDGCIGAWCPGLGPTGLSLYDHSGMGKPGTLTNFTAANAWKVNQGWAIDFDKAASPPNHVYWAERPFDPRTVATSPFTFAIWAWVKSWTGTEYDPGSSFWNMGSADYQILGISLYLKKLVCIGDSTGTGTWDVGWSGSSALYLHPDEMPLGAWVHYAVTRDVLGNYRGYVNGKYGGSFNNTSTLVINDNVMKVGGHYSLNETYDTDAYLDDWSIYNRALSPDEIALLARQRGIAYTPRRPRRFYSFPPSFLPAWARNRVAHIIGGGLR